MVKETSPQIDVFQITESQLYFKYYIMHHKHIQIHLFITSNYSKLFH